jgi:hypothetical protein
MVGTPIAGQMPELLTGVIAVMPTMRPSPDQTIGFQCTDLLTPMSGAADVRALARSLTQLNWVGGTASVARVLEPNSYNGQPMPGMP